MNLVADIINQSLDACGSDKTIGDAEEGTREASVSLRAYGQCLRQLLRAAHWDFARRQAPLVLLADATGQTLNVGSLVPIPWYYEYQLPPDSMKIRFIPQNYGQFPSPPAGNIQIPSNVPLTTATGVPNMLGQRLRPARFLVANDPNYASAPGQIFWETQGQAPTGSTVILTNVKNATVVYTGLMLYPSTWDPLFRAAMVAYLASEIALPLNKDKKFAMQLRKDNIEIAKAKIKEARVIDGNEGFFSSDIRVDWMETRRTGGWGTGRGGWGDGGGPGVFGYGWDSCGFADGSAY